IELAASTYHEVTVKGYDAPIGGNVTYFGSAYNVPVYKSETTVLEIYLLKIGTVKAKAGIEFVSIPSGSFQLGGAVLIYELEPGVFMDRCNCNPEHKVNLSGFDMSIYEIT
ncbi:MAG: hypothetical protein ACYC9O_15850, partial [Candidatus Latescibacterota bacterium]